MIAQFRPTFVPRSSRVRPTFEHAKSVKNQQSVPASHVSRAPRARAHARTRNNTFKPGTPGTWDRKGKA